MLFRRNKEAAFSNYRLWESAGFVIAYAYSTTLCARMKLYVLVGNLVLGVIGYIIVEIRHRRKVSDRHNPLNFLTFLFLTHFMFHFRSNRNVDLRNKRLKKMQPVKLKRPNKKSKRPMTRKMIWKRILKSHTSKMIWKLDASQFQMIPIVELFSKFYEFKEWISIAIY